MIPADRSPTSRFDLFARLSEPALYIAAAERMRERQASVAEFRPLAADGPWLQGVTDLPRLARALARDVAKGAFEFGPMHAREAWIRGEKRTLFVATPLEEIVLGALASGVSELLEGYLSPRVYSYRRGRSALRAVEDWLAYLRAHRARSSDRRNWGVYVLRRDVRGYGDAIPSGADSAFWPMLSEVLARAGSTPTPAQAAWLREAFRPKVADASGAGAPTARGIPTGSPVQPAACNLYLTPIDRTLESIPGAFYARYGDDMLFAHPDPNCVADCARELDAGCAALGLEWSSSKCATLYFNLAGRNPPDAHAAFKGAAALDYLGMRIDFRGVIGLKRDKSRRLLRDLALRLQHSGALLRELGTPDLERDLCSVANAVLDPEHPSANPSAVALRYLVSDRAQLRDLDYKIALLVAQQLATRRGVRAFRSHSPRRLREQLGLVSLVSARNHFGRSRARQPAAAHD